MEKGKEPDDDFQLWSRADVLAVQRHSLIAGAKARAQARQSCSYVANCANETPVDRSVPSLLHGAESIYRYTRGVNDLTNPGMGYGELTHEQRMLRIGEQLIIRNARIRRTRSGRQGAPIKAGQDKAKKKDAVSPGGRSRRGPKAP
jgi:hypothetical protein